MKLVRESVSLFTLLGELNELTQEQLGKHIELCGRQCYQSSHKIGSDSYLKFIKNMIQSGHLSMAEHVSVTANITTNRGISHQLVRHRLGSYSQESTRYCNYSSGRFGNELTFITPVWISDKKTDLLKFQTTSETLITSIDDPDLTWYNSVLEAEKFYLTLLDKGYTPEKAREVLPNSLATNLSVTYNLRTWRHILSQRLDQKCHPQMRYLMALIAIKFLTYIPIFFEDFLSFSSINQVISEVSTGEKR